MQDKRRRLSYCLCGLILVAVLVVKFQCPILYVRGSSMYPTYSEGDYLLSMKVRKAEDIPARNPVCWVTDNSGNDVIKRLVGYPGDIVLLKNDVTFVNGIKIMVSEHTNSGRQEFILDENEYLFLGDNRNDSLDGRYWNPHTVSLAQIHSYVIFSELPTKGDL